MTRTLLILCMAAAMLAAKDRAWQTGVLLNKDYNPYFKTTAVSENGVKASANSSFVADDNGAMTADTRTSSGDVAYDNYIVQGSDTVYLVEYARFKGFPAPNLSVLKPFTFAVEKNKVYIKDLDRHEFETSILKQTERRAPGALASAAPAEPAKADKPASAPAKVEQAKIEQPKPVQQAKVEPAKQEQPKPEQPKPAGKSDDLFARAPQTSDDAKAKQTATVPAKPVAVQKPASQVQEAVTKTAAKDTPSAKPAPKPQPRVEASVAKPSKPEQGAPVARPEVKPAAKPEQRPEPKVEAAVTKPAPSRPEGPVVRPTTKDRAWQSGQLLSVANNNYFFNVTYTSDQDGSTWPFSQGSDGRLTVTGRIAANTESYYTYDNYVVESEFVAYLMQRMRPKTSPAVRLPGTKALKFAVDKGKMWVLDEQGIEYEFKVVKLIQKDAIVDPLTRAAAR